MNLSAKCGIFAALNVTPGVRKSILYMPFLGAKPALGGGGFAAHKAVTFRHNGGMGEKADSHARTRVNVEAQAKEPHAWVRPRAMPNIAPISQLAIAYPILTVLWFVCMMSASPGYEFLGTVIFLMIGPIFVMVAGVALGLPVRLNRRLSRWWLGNWRVYILIAAAGAGLLISGFNLPERQVGEIDGIPFDVITPHSGLLTAGCFVLTFLAVNASLPFRFSGRTGQDRAV